MSNPEPAATTESSKSFINCKNLSASFSFTQRLINSCSTPHNSGNSDKIVAPPIAAIISDK